MRPSRLPSCPITKKQDLLSDLETTKKRGYSFNKSEHIQDVICIGASLLNFLTQKVVGAIRFDFPDTEQSLDSIEQKYVGKLTKLANEISETITLTKS